MFIQKRESNCQGFLQYLCRELVNRLDSNLDIHSLSTTRDDPTLCYHHDGNLEILRERQCGAP